MAKLWRNFIRENSKVSASAGTPHLLSISSIRVGVMIYMFDVAHICACVTKLKEKRSARGRKRLRNRRMGLAVYFIIFLNHLMYIKQCRTGETLIRINK